VKAKLAAVDIKLQLLGILVGVGIFGFVLHMLVVSPKSASVAKIQAQIDDLQTQVYTRRSASKTAQLPPTIATADLFRLTRAMPDREDMPGIILTLSQVAQAAGIKFDMIEPVFGDTTTVPTGGPYTTHRVHLTFRGDFYGLSDFLFRLRNLVAVRDGNLIADGRLFNVDTLTFSSNTQAFPTINAEVYVQAYVYSPGTAPSASAPAPGASGSSTTTTPSPTTPTTPPETSPTGATALGAS
jgi:Tfp pilus assembly protein PilO